MAFGSLTIQYSDGRTETLAIDRPALNIGRSRANDIVISDVEVAERHAQILADASGCQIIDLGSGNGTEVDSVRILSAHLQVLNTGSTIRIGGARITVTIGAGGRRQPGVTPTLPASNDDLLGSLLGQQLAGATRKGTQPIQRPPTSRRAPPPPVAPPDVDIGLTLQPVELTVAPGGAVLLAVTIVNRSTFVDRIELSVEGLGQWATIDVAAHNLLPNTVATATISVQPPRAPTSYAGTHRFEVLARSEKRPDLRFAAAGALTITPYSEFRAELLDPKVRTAWFRGRYTMRVRNTGNAARAFVLTGQNDEEAFRFAFRPDPLEIEPGAVADSELRARLKLLRLFGTPKTYPFTVVVEPADESAPAQPLQGRLVQRPPLPPWLLLTLALLTLAALLLLCGFITIYRVAPFIAGLFPTAVPTAVTITPGTETPVAGPTIFVTRETVVVEGPTPIIIYPTIIIPTPAPPGVVTVQVPQEVTSPPLIFTPTPDQVIEFSKLAGQPVAQPTGIAGDEYIQQQATFCFYREALPTAVAPSANQSPTEKDGFRLSVSESTDPARVGDTITYQVRAEVTTGLTVQEAVISARFPPELGARAVSGNCKVLPDGTLSCDVSGLSQRAPQQVEIAITPPKAGQVSAAFQLDARYQAATGSSGGVAFQLATPQAGAAAQAAPPTTSLGVTANTLVQAAPGQPPRLTDCGLDRLDLISEELRQRASERALTQSQPVIYPPGTAAGSPLALLTTDASPGQPATDVIGVINLQRVVNQISIDLWFPGPTGDFFRIVAFDEQGKFITEQRTDRLTVPGRYVIPLVAGERPIKQVVIQVKSFDDYNRPAPSSNGVFLLRVELRYAPT